MEKIIKTVTNYQSPDFCDIEWITSFSFHNNSIIAEYFEEAGDRLVDSVSKNRKGNADDGLFIPISYLYRHSAELLLKEIIKNAYTIEYISKAAIDKLKLENTHNLQKLLNVAIKAIKKRYPDGDKKDLEKTKKTINYLHNMDPNGQGFKYSHDNKTNKSSSKFPKHVNLIEYRKLIKEALLLLNSCNSEFRKIK